MGNAHYGRFLEDINMEDCIFCKISNGDLGTEFIYEDETAVVFKDINPKADIHLLVVPKEHVQDLNECSAELIGKLMSIVKKVTVQENIKSFRTVINTGKDAGQEVFHLHIHILSGNIKF